MPTWLIAVIVVLIVAAAAFAILLFAFPGKLVAIIQSLAARKAGVTKRSIKVGDRVVHYYEGGEGPDLVLLHGMSDEKNSFVTAAGELTQSYRVVMPDLRGHGENEHDASLDHSISGQAQHVWSFLQALSIDRFYIGGNSMGGHTSAALTLKHPDAVQGLILVNAPGPRVDDHLVYAGMTDPLDTLEDFYALLDRVVHVRPTMPAPVVKQLMKEINSNRQWSALLAEQITSGQDYDLLATVGDISAPTLVLWGKHDEVVRFNVAQYYVEKISDATLVVMDDFSHSPQVQDGPAVGREILRWLESVDER